MNLKISSKIAVALSLMVVLMAVLGLNSFFTSQQSLNNVKNIQSDNQRAVTASHIENELTAAALDMRRYISDLNEQSKTSFEQRLAKVLDLETQLLQASTTENKPEVEKLLAGTKGYRDGILNHVVPLLKEQATAQDKNDISKQLSGQIKELTVLTQSNQQIISNTVDRESQSVVQRVEQAERGSAQSQSLALILLVISLIIAVTLGVILRRMITRPVAVLVAELNNIANGDLSKTDHKILQRQDEFGQLYSALQKSKEGIRKLINVVQLQAEQLSAASEQLNASADQSAQVANQVAISITEVASGATKQVDAVDATTTVVEQMSASIEQVEANTNFVAEKSNKTVEMAKKGGRSVEQAVSQMANVERTVNNSAQVVAKLGDRSKEIGQIVDTIAGIAGQTNLLALNAAIEAARAGEQGRGFAVVAEEVRKLAEQSQEAAKQIALLIGGIQGDTDKAVLAMSEGTREVKVGSEVVITAGQAFTEIAGLVTQVSEQVKDITTAIGQMVAGSQQIVVSVKEIDGLSKQAAGQAQTVSAATEEQSAAMEEIAASSQSLAKLAQNLQEGVSKFRV